MIGNDIILPNNVYVSKGYISEKLDASDSNITLNDERNILLAKGTKVQIVAFHRASIFNLISYYDIELETNLNKQVLSELDPEALTKGHKKNRLYLWSNNFFDALNILNDKNLGTYSTTINPLFNLLTFLYPFTLIYLILQSFNNSMNKINSNYKFHPLSPIIYIVAYYYVLMSSINDGFSGFLLGIPYSIFLVWEIFYINKKSKIKFLHIFILLLSLFFLVSDRSKSQFLYPMVGKTYTINNDINYSYGNFHINMIKIYDKIYFNHGDNLKPMFQLKPGDKFNIGSQSVSGHADMGISYTFRIESKNFSELRSYISNNLNVIKSELSNDYTKNFNRTKTEFYADDKKEFYINEYDLRRLMKRNDYVYDIHNIENGYTYFSFYLLIYPIIMALFFLILTFRNKKIFY